MSIRVTKVISCAILCMLCLSTNAQVFSSAGHTKSNGLSIEIHYPSNWEASEGIRPHVVQKFTDKDANQCMLVITNIGQTLSENQWENEFKHTTLADYSEMLSGKVVSVKRTKYEGLSGALVQYETTAERSGIKIYTLGLAHIFGYKNSVVMVQCMVGDLTKQDAKKKYENVMNDFMSFGNGVVVLDKYTLPAPIEKETTSTNIEKETISTNYEFLVYMFFAIVIVLLFVSLRHQEKTQKRKSTKGKKQR